MRDIYAFIAWLMDCALLLQILYDRFRWLSRRSFNRFTSISSTAECQLTSVPWFHHKNYPWTSSRFSRFDALDCSFIYSYTDIVILSLLRSTYHSFRSTCLVCIGISTIISKCIAGRHSTSTHLTSHSTLTNNQQATFESIRLQER